MKIQADNNESLEGFTTRTNIEESILDWKQNIFFPRYSFDFIATTDRMRDESKMRIRFKI